MSFHNKKFNFDDDDEDLESLRLAALKSLATKKETTSPLNGGNAIEVLDNGPVSRNISTVRPINTLDNANLHVRLDVTEPYVPQNVPNVARVDWNYNAAYIGNMHAKPIVIPTLSPRSLAFVEQNNDILNRRKGEKSTRSPSPYREDFMRWSETPPPLLKRRSSSFRKSISRTMSRSPVLNTRFSKSPLLTVKSPRRITKSPIRNTRLFKKRSKSRSGRGSRSPVRRGASQIRTHSERRRSTSLYSSSHQNKFSGRITTTKQNDRLTPPAIRHRRSSRSQSPVHLRNKSLTPPSQLARTNRKRSRSPYQPTHHLKRSRSNSRSPHRKARPRSREFGSGGGAGGYSKSGNNNKHYANKNIEFNRKYLSQNNYSNRNNNKYQNNNKSYNSNKYDNRREPPRSPTKYRSKSKSPATHHHSDTGSKSEGKKVTSASINSNKIESSISNKDIAPHNELEHDKLSSTDDDDQNSTEDDDNNDEDGIDLFASEESESENEGRFKSSSKNTDNKKIATLSYSKLSETAVVSELKDMNANTNWNEREYSRRNNGDRDRDRDRRSRRGGNRDDNWKNSRRNRTKDEENVSRNSKKTEKSTSSNSGSANGMKMFRSTFQAVDDGVLSTKKEGCSKFNEDKSISKNTIEGNSETRNVLHLKRSLIQTKEVDKDAMPAEESKNVHETSVSTESTSGKKPIHLRLGAISNSSSKVGSGGGSGSGGSSGNQNQSGKSNTSWKSKKSWRTEKV